MEKTCLLTSIFAAVVFVHATIPGFQLPGSQQGQQQPSTTVAPQGSQFQVNIKFIPAIRISSCSLFQFWTPTDLECGMCFCMTGTVSRCVPQPGCTPTGQNGTTTVAPVASMEPTPETPVLPEKPNEENEVDTEKPATEKPTNNRRRNKFFRAL